VTHPIYDAQVETIEGELTDLSAYRGKVLLIVNTASKCGFTPQFGGLEQMYEKFKDRGFAILGFPCNQFASQDPGSNTEIAGFCQKNYGVSFPMFSKIEVNGPGTHPLYDHLKKAKPGLLGTPQIKWNFTKFLVDREGRVVERYGSRNTPAEIAKDVERLL